MMRLLFNSSKSGRGLSTSFLSKPSSSSKTLTRAKSGSEEDPSLHERPVVAPLVSNMGDALKGTPRPWQIPAKGKSPISQYKTTSEKLEALSHVHGGKEAVAFIKAHPKKVEELLNSRAVQQLMERGTKDVPTLKSYGAITTRDQLADFLVSRFGLYDPIFESEIIAGLLGEMTEAEVKDFIEDPDVTALLNSDVPSFAALVDTMSMKNLPLPIPNGLNDEITEYADGATGPELAEIVAEEQGVKLHANEPLTGPFGTLERPVLVPSNLNFRHVGCMGGAPSISHPLSWMELNRGRKHSCTRCGQVFQLVTPAEYDAIRAMWSEEDGVLDAAEEVTKSDDDIIAETRDLIADGLTLAERDELLSNFTAPLSTLPPSLKDTYLSKLEIRKKIIGEAKIVQRVEHAEAH